MRGAVSLRAFADQVASETEDDVEALIGQCLSQCRKRAKI
jgi:hypothetical protein